MSNSYNTFGSRIFKITRLQKTLTISSSLRISNPYRFLGVIDLLLVCSLHLNRWEQKLCWVRVSLTLHELDMARHGG